MSNDNPIVYSKITVNVDEDYDSNVPLKRSVAPRDFLPPQHW